METLAQAVSPLGSLLESLEHNRTALFLTHLQNLQDLAAIHADYQALAKHEISLRAEYDRLFQHTSALQKAYDGLRAAFDPPR